MVYFSCVGGVRLFAHQKRKMTHYPHGQDVSTAKREKFFPVYTESDTHPYWTAFPLCESDRLAQNALTVNRQLLSMAQDGTMGSPLRMWNTAGTTIPLGNVKQFNTAANVVKSDMSVLPFGQVSLDPNYPFPPGAQRTFGFG